MTPERIRAPILQTIRKSPFSGLVMHSQRVKECIEEYQLAVKYYVDEDYKSFKKHSTKVSKIEHKADLLKGNIRNHLPKFIFMPVDKGDFLMLLKESDAILDHAEDVVKLMEMRKSKVPDELKDDFTALTDKIVETVDNYENAMDNFKTLLETSFGAKIRDETKKLIHAVHHCEYESDKIEQEISKKLFNAKDLDPITTIHLLKIVDRMGDIADHAENAADRIRAMMAK